MTKKKPTKRGLISEGSLYKFLHIALFLLFISNLYVVYTFERDRQPQIVERRVTVTTNHVQVVTNFISSSSSSSVPGVDGVFASTNAPNDKKFEIEVPYRMFICRGLRSVEIGGRYFSEGSPTSYGKIVRIWPDRVSLDNGYYLKNFQFEQRFSYDERPNEIYSTRRYDYEQRINKDRDDFQRRQNDTIVVEQHNDLWRTDR